MPPSDAAASSGLPQDALATLFGAEPTQYGVLCTPDKDAACGPIYSAVIEKVADISTRPVMAAVSGDSDDEGSEEEQAAEGAGAGDAATGDQ